MSCSQIRDICRNGYMNSFFKLLILSSESQSTSNLNSKVGFEHENPIHNFNVHHQCGFLFCQVSIHTFTPKPGRSLGLNFSIFAYPNWIKRGSVLQSLIRIQWNISRKWDRKPFREREEKKNPFFSNDSFTFHDYIKNVCLFLFGNFKAPNAMKTEKQV